MPLQVDVDGYMAQLICHHQECQNVFPGVNPRHAIPALDEDL